MYRILFALVLMAAACGHRVSPVTSSGLLSSAAVAAEAPKPVPSPDRKSEKTTLAFDPSDSIRTARWVCTRPAFHPEKATGNAFLDKETSDKWDASCKAIHGKKISWQFTVDRVYGDDSNPLLEIKYFGDPTPPREFETKYHAALFRKDRIPSSKLSQYSVYFSSPQGRKISGEEASLNPTQPPYDDFPIPLALAKKLRAGDPVIIEGEVKGVVFGIEEIHESVAKDKYVYRASILIDKAVVSKKP